MSTTHCSELKLVCRLTAMSGNATLTIVTSTSSISVPTQIVSRGNHLRISGHTFDEWFVWMTVGRLGDRHEPMK